MNVKILEVEAIEHNYSEILITLQPVLVYVFTVNSIEFTLFLTA